MQKSGTTNLTNNTNLKRKTIRRKGGGRMRKAKTTTDVTDFTDNTDRRQSREDGELACWWPTTFSLSYPHFLSV